MRSNSLFISLLLSTKVHKATKWNSHTLHIWERKLYDGQLFLKFLRRILKLSYIFCLGYFWQYRQTAWIKILARFVGWILSPIFNRRCLWRCCRCSPSCFLLFGQRASALSTVCLFACLACLLYTLLSKHFSAFHSVEQGYGETVFYSNSIKVSKCIRTYRERSSFACNQNIKEYIFTTLEVLLCFETKRNET